MGDWSHASTAVSTAPVNVVPVVDPPRSFAILVNNGTGPLYFGASNVSTNAFGYSVAASGSFLLSNREMANAALWAMAPTARTVNILSKV